MQTGVWAPRNDYRRKNYGGAQAFLVPGFAVPCFLLGSITINNVPYETPGLVFPEGEGLPPDPQAPFGPVAVPLEQFERLTTIPIQLVFGDYFEGTQWEERLANARLFAAIVNAHGGDAEVLLLPEAGLAGNTHIPMADLNNREVAQLLAEWLERKGLAGYARR